MLQVYFDPKTWNIKKNDLILYDPLSEKELKKELSKMKIIWDAECDYDELGMQGTNYVTFDVGMKFETSFHRAMKRLERA